jgi:anthranilate phosphoribosyltransferase
MNPTLDPASDLKPILAKLVRQTPMSRDEARRAFDTMMSEGADPVLIGGMLTALAAKGCTLDELVGVAQAMTAKATPVDTRGLDVVLDTCGTGGDVKNTFNISTTAAILIAACGVKVVKHGNRSASGRSGSADVLEHLGVKLDASPLDTRKCLDVANICFAFARAHHPAMKFVAPVRQALGIPTVFNLVGPLTNPGRAKFQLLGVFRPDLTTVHATALRELGSTRAWVVHGEDGLDELSTMAPNRVAELRDGQIKTFTLDAQSYDLPRAKLADLQVDSVAQSADALKSVFSGQASPMRDIAVFNAAAGLLVAGVVPSIEQGIMRACFAIDSGEAGQTLVRLVSASNGEL